jgi:hypothetical protein
MSGCFYHEPWEYNHEHHRYRHRRWREETVYLREDGRWYARRNNRWVFVAVID